MVFTEEEMMFPENFTYYRLDDDTMSPQLPCGAILTIRKMTDPNADIDPRKIYFVEVNSSVRYVRYLMQIDGKIALLPNNRFYPYELFDLSENNIRIIGTVESCFMQIKNKE